MHADHHRPADQATPDRYARHYADMERLLRHPDATTMLADHALCARVVEWKSRVSARQWSRYDLARPGTFQLLPTEERLAVLARDYGQMRSMFIKAPPEFDVMVSRLASGERMSRQALQP